jgi:hypothetical protein
METNDHKEELITAYELIRDLTVQVADLTLLVTPLVRALDPKHDRQPLRFGYLLEQQRIGDELIQLKTDSVAAIENVIRRLKER